MRLDLFVRNKLPLLLKNNSHFSNLEKEELLKLPRSFWKKEIILGNIKIQNKLVKPSYNIDNSKLSYVNIVWKNIKNNWNMFFREHLLSYPAPLNIILIKPSFIVINKPVGLSVHPAFPLNQKLPRSTSVIEVLASRYPEVKLVHRLDKETGGVLLIARNYKTTSCFKKQFKARKVKKVYYALVEGEFPYKRFSLEGMIGKSLKNPLLRSLSGVNFRDLSSNVSKPINSVVSLGKIINPKNSLTFGEKVTSGTLNDLEKTKTPVKKIVGFWKKYLKDNKRKFTLLKLTPQTGRTHQLRVHLGTIGFPIVGDKLYGGPRNRDLPFHCLHAFSLQWLDPNSTLCSAKTAEIIVFQ